MFETKARVRVTIPEEVMLGRLAQSEQAREFFIEMWKQNPSLARQGGVNVQNLLTPLERVDAEECVSDLAGAARARQRGISLIELIMFIVIVSVALAGILLVMNTVTQSSADPIIHKQALAIAESLLEEIELQDFSKPDGGFAGPFTPANRFQFDTVTDYNGYATSGVVAPNAAATPIPGLANYNVLPITVANAMLGAIPATSAVVITVTVRAPSGETIDAVGYRTAY